MPGITSRSLVQAAAIIPACVQMLAAAAAPPLRAQGVAPADSTSTVVRLAARIERLVRDSAPNLPSLGAYTSNPGSGSVAWGTRDSLGEPVAHSSVTVWIAESAEVAKREFARSVLYTSISPTSGPGGQSPPFGEDVCVWYQWGVGTHSAIRFRQGAFIAHVDGRTYEEAEQVARLTWRAVLAESGASSAAAAAAGLPVGSGPPRCRYPDEFKAVPRPTPPRR